VGSKVLKPAPTILWQMEGSQTYQISYNLPTRQHVVEKGAWHRGFSMTPLSLAAGAAQSISCE